MMFSKIIQKIIIFILRFLFFPIVRLVWVRKVSGLENIPQNGPVILAFNHQSYFDFIGFMAITPRPVYYLAAEKFYTKETHWLWSSIFDATGQIRVDRSSKDKSAVHSTVQKTLSEGKMLGIFPEGTRVPDRLVMQRGFTGVAKFAISNNVPIIPVGIRGAYEIMSRSDRRPRFSKVLEFIIGEPIDLHQANGVMPDKDTLQQMTDSVMRVIAKLSSKEYPYGK